MALELSEIAQGQVECAHGQFGAVNVIRRQGLEVCLDVLHFDLSGLVHLLALCKLCHRVRTGIGIHASANNKRYVLNAIADNMKIHIDTVTAITGSLTEAVRFFDHLVPIGAKRHFKVAQGVILPEINRLFCHRACHLSGLSFSNPSRGFGEGLGEGVVAEQHNLRAFATHQDIILALR